MERFQQECGFLESIRHPNIVQYLGTATDPESRLPVQVLLMELLDESLTKMLERSQQSLAYGVQVDICHDIALAVAYLHSNDIIHRDLSSNNVLMIAGTRAKVTDFGMSKLASAAPSMTPLTMCPGTQAYMPPEALRDPPRYTKKLDCFSEGVIMIQVCTRLWPEPGPRTELRADPTSPTGEVEVPVLETIRRRNHIDMIQHDHPLLPIINHSLQYQERSRPSSEELCQRLADLKESREYKENTHSNIQPSNDQVIMLTQQLQEKDRMLLKKDDESMRRVQEKDRELQQKDNEIQERDRLLQQKERQLQEERASRERQIQEELMPRERQLRQLNQQLEEQEQLIAEIQQANHSLQRQVEQLQQQLSQQSLMPPQPPPPSQAQIRGRQLQERESRKQLPVQPSLHVDHKPHPHRVRKTTLNWRDGSKAPFKICRGAAVVNGDVAYFMNCENQVCSYNVSSKKWSKLPECPYLFSSLAVINGQLTAIGGCKVVDNEDTYTNKLLCLPGYKEVFPAMPTKRRGTTAVTSKQYLIVAGGIIGILSEVNIVEVMNTKSLVWSRVASLPHPYFRASGTICGDRLYMLGGWDDEDRTKSVLTCSLTELLRSSSSSSIWHRVADAPAGLSTCAAVNGELLAVGGHMHDKDDKPLSAIHKYNQTTNSWNLISNMPTARFFSLVAVLPTNEMMVVGGCTDTCTNINKVEVAHFSLP